MTIRCLYSCSTCGLKDVAVAVPARNQEDVISWMDETIRLLAADHFARRPECKGTSLQEIKIPMVGAAKIGGPTIQ